MYNVGLQVSARLWLVLFGHHHCQRHPICQRWEVSVHAFVHMSHSHGVNTAATSCIVLFVISHFLSLCWPHRLSHLVTLVMWNHNIRSEVPKMFITHDHITDQIKPLQHTKTLHCLGREIWCKRCFIYTYMTLNMVSRPESCKYFSVKYWLNSFCYKTVRIVKVWNPLH